jgi:peptide/nickel transport system permease protein
MTASTAQLHRPGATRRLWADRSARVGLALVFLLALTALLADVLAPGDPSALGPASLRLHSPSAAHPLGTDVLGRDVLQRLVYGSRVSLVVGWIGVAVAVLCGTLIGLVSGLGPGWLDRSLMALTDLFLAFPRIFLVLLLTSVSSPSLTLVMLVLGLTGWMGVARLVRAEVLSLRERDFVAAARGLGLGPWHLAWRHLLPHVLPVVVVAATLRVGNIILLESFLSFLGLGAQEPTVSWGAMIDQGRGYLLEGWWLATFPGLAITLTVIGYNLLGDGLREILDPRRAAGGGEHDRRALARR